MNKSHNTLDAPGSNIRCFLVGRSKERLDELDKWGRQNSESEFALGVLATMNYVLRRDLKPPRDRTDNADSIRMAGESQDWMDAYFKTFDQ